MHPLRTIAKATAVECCFISAILSGLGFWGLFDERLDVANIFAPLTLVMAITGVVLCLGSLEAGPARSICVGLAAVALIPNGLLLAPDLVHSAKAQLPSGPARYRILSVDLSADNYIPKLAMDEVMRQPADAVLLQDWSGGDAGEVERLARIYPQSTRCPGSSVRVFVKTRIVAEGCGLYANPQTPGLAWLRTIGPDGRPLTLASVHRDWPAFPKRQTRDRNALAAMLATLGGSSMIVAGDFDILPWTAAMRAEDKALVPLRRRTLLWPSWPARINLLGRAAMPPVLAIDHLYASPDWRSAKLGRLRIPGASHYGMAVDLGRGP